MRKYPYCELLRSYFATPASGRFLTCNTFPHALLFGLSRSLEQVTSSSCYRHLENMCDSSGQLGGIADVASAVVSLPTVLAASAVFFSAMQGVIVLESADPCRLSTRKMNILLALEFAEVLVSATSEILSFVELRAALMESLQWLQWVAPCLLAAGMLETLVDVYFTFAMVTTSRVGWMPFSATGGSDKAWEVFPFMLTCSLSASLVGWRLRWWWTGNTVASEIAIKSVSDEMALSKGVMGFAVGWTVAVSGLVFIIIMLSDCAEDGANYIASIPYLWKPDEWLNDQHGDIKIWYRNTKGEDSLQQYVATAALDGTVPIPETETDVLLQLEKKPLHCGNAIVGKDQDHLNQENRSTSGLHKIILIAEHLVVLPLLFVVVFAVGRLHDTLDCTNFNALKQLADGVIIISLLEVAIGIKNILWSVSGVAKGERTKPSSDERLRELREFYGNHLREGESTSLNDLNIE